MENNEVAKIPVWRLIGESGRKIEDVVARESPLTIFLNNQELVTLLCSPKDLGYLAIGFLFSEGLLGSKAEIKKIMVDEQRGVVRVETEGADALADELVFKRFITSGSGRGASFYSAADVQNQVKIESQTQISTNDVHTLMKEFIRHSEVFKTTGGVHSAALCDTKSILVFNEDIGRHNAIDKIFGECLLDDIPTDGRLIITSGRISSEILLKVAKRNLPILISKSAPTDLGVKLADDLGITLLGFVRGKRINVYTNDWRIVNDGR
ncbi:MAG: formate dehydrogenase accessory sulfurtransferase FdhD [Chloroflexi bacterium]|nr:formate dehydrogenase accessory sulfurtransferase FdhD [Chloroflexota bacterium]